MTERLGDNEGTQLRSTVDRLFAALVSARVLAESEAGVWPEAAWSAVAELGLPGALIPEEAGGFGLPMVDALSLLGTAGAHALPLPLAEAMIAGFLLARAGFEVPAGVLSLADASGLALLRAGGGWRVRGVLPGVAWGRRADAVAALVVADGVPAIALLSAGAWEVETGANMAREPRDTLRLDQPVVVRPAPAGFGPPQLRALGATARSLMMAGALQRLCAMTTEYAQTRVQFGRAIGKFQAVQQNLAILAGQAAAAAAAAELGAEAVAAGINLPGVAVAKARVGEAAGLGSGVAHQIHGAIGFTYEHRLHFFTKRLLSWRNEYGTEAEWTRLLGREIALAGADALWPTLTAL